MINNRDNVICIVKRTADYFIVKQLLTLVKHIPRSAVFSLHCDRDRDRDRETPRPHL